MCLDVTHHHQYSIVVRKNSDRRAVRIRPTTFNDSDFKVVILPPQPLILGLVQARQVSVVLYVRIDGSLRNFKLRNCWVSGYLEISERIGVE